MKPDEDVTHYKQLIAVKRSTELERSSAVLAYHRSLFSPAEKKLSHFQ